MMQPPSGLSFIDFRESLLGPIKSMTGNHSYGAKYMEVHLIPTVLMVLPERGWTGLHGHGNT